MLVNEEYASILFLLLESLKEVAFSLRVDDPLLGHLHYWDLMAQSAAPLSPVAKKPSTPAASSPHSKAPLSTPSSPEPLPLPPQSPPKPSESVVLPTTTPSASDSILPSASPEPSATTPADQELVLEQSAIQDDQWSAAMATDEETSTPPASNTEPLAIDPPPTHSSVPLDLRPDTPSDPSSLPLSADSPRRDTSLATTHTAPKFIESHSYEHTSPFPSDYDEVDSSDNFKSTPPVVFQHVLHTPPGSGRLPSTPPSAQPSLGSSFNTRAPMADALLGTTPSQADLPTLLASINSNLGLSQRHSTLISGLQAAAQGLKSTLELRDIITMRLPLVRDLLTSIELILLDNFAQVASLDTQYSLTWEWLSSVSPATPHVTHILAPLAQLSQLTHLSHAIRCRTFINASLNRKCFDSILASLIQDTATTNSSLNPDRLLANESLRTVFFKIIQDLKQHQFDLPENPSDSLLLELPSQQIAVPVTLPTPPTSPSPPPPPSVSPKPEDSEKPASFKRKKKVVTISEAPATPAKSRVERPPTPPASPPQPTFDPLPTAMSPNPFDSEPATLAPEREATQSPPPVAPEETLSLPSWSIMHNEDPVVNSDSDSDTEDAPSEVGTWRVVAAYNRPTIEREPSTPSISLGDPTLSNIQASVAPPWSSEDEDLPIDASTLPTYEPAPGTGGRRNRSFSGNAPSWAKQIQQFPAMGSYRPNTDWLGGSDEVSEPVSFSPPPRMTIGSSPSSHSSPTSSPSSLPFRFLNANIISEYVPSPKRPHNAKEEDSSASSSSSSSSEVVKIRALEGEEALIEDSMLYKNSKPADFFILELVSKPRLTAKNSLCSGCGEDLSPSTARWCAYSSNFYCSKCHSNKKAILPARVIKQWNFKPAKVSNYAYDYLQSNWNRPVLDVASLDQEQIGRSGGRETTLGLPIPIKLPLISRTKGSSVSIINHLTLLRERLVSVAEFIRACRNGHRLLTSLAERLHLLWSSTLWSMQDLVDAKTGKLEPLLKKFIGVFSAHVRSCDSCSGKGYVCEICQAKEVIYPFEADTASCPNCKALFHESCWKSHPGKCPKCVRVRAIRGKER